MKSGNATTFVEMNSNTFQMLLQIKKNLLNINVRLVSLKIQTFALIFDPRKPRTAVVASIRTVI